MESNVDTMVWAECQTMLRSELPEQQYNTWIRPLTIQSAEGAFDVHLLAPNRFIEDWVKNKFLSRIEELLAQLGGKSVKVDIKVSRLDLEGFRAGAVPDRVAIPVTATAPVEPYRNNIVAAPAIIKSAAESSLKTNLNPNFTFDSFVEGKSNQLAFAAARQVAENPGGSYNPLFIYGGVGLGKTHLMHAVGHAMRAKNPEAKIVYLHSERFVADMVKALQLKAIDEFKQFYRSVDALLIDDIQFFSGKERSQEEFFHTYNALLEGGQQMILTCDRYPKEIDGVEERLKSGLAGG